MAGAAAALQPMAALGAPELGGQDLAGLQKEAAPRQGPPHAQGGDHGALCPPAAPQAAARQLGVAARAAPTAAASPWKDAQAQDVQQPAAPGEGKVARGCSLYCTGRCAAAEQAAAASGTAASFRRLSARILPCPPAAGPQAAAAAPPPRRSLDGSKQLQAPAAGRSPDAALQVPSPAPAGGAAAALASPAAVDRAMAEASAVYKSGDYARAIQMCQAVSLRQCFGLRARPAVCCRRRAFSGAAAPLLPTCGS